MMEKSILIKADNKPTSQSAKTTIPKAILNQWDLKVGDELLWELAEIATTGETVVIVRPEHPKVLKKVKPCKK